MPRSTEVWHLPRLLMDLLREGRRQAGEKYSATTVPTKMSILVVLEELVALPDLPVTAKFCSPVVSGGL